ncbi:uncharacterized protein FTOL_05253 [Fusarium torulosum]|uniref:Uncharacterized protein n=1 Tax=Fusarium torulosum TaxID=33205 RepID=A0AAE8M7J5_9HYPO|nr:uncharacterized protein FTOL_05253 [Fusarium torulosum]
MPVEPVKHNHKKTQDIPVAYIGAWIQDVGYSFPRSTDGNDGNEVDWETESTTRWQLLLLLCLIWAIPS